MLTDFIFVLIASLNVLSYSFMFVPPPLPLAPFPVVTSEELIEYATEVASVIGGATIPTKPDEVLALVISESIAGFIGGNIEKYSALIVNDQEGFNSTLRGSVTTAYFGFRGGIRFVTNFVGIPSFISRPLSGVLASIVAELLKAFDRKRENKRKSHLEQEKQARNHLLRQEVSLPKVDSAVSPLISVPEIMKDVSKWVAYDAILPAEYSQNVPIVIAAEVGALSGLIGFIIAEVFRGKVDLSIANGKNFLRSIFEAMTLFAAYEGSLNLLEISTTPEIKKFLQKEFVDLHLMEGG
jgi:hypothetical protein